MPPDFDWLAERYVPDPADRSPASFDWLKEDLVLEAPDSIPRPLCHRRRPSRRIQLRALRQEKLEEFFTSLPQPGQTLHMVSNGSFDYWNFVPVALQLLGRPACFYGSTWTMNRSNVLQLLALFDKEKLTAVTMFSGLYFKRREPAVYTALASGLIDRGQRFLCFENHTKIILLGAEPDYLVMEGSANFTANPRTEQNTVTNDEELFEFHRAWMEEMLARCRKHPTLSPTANTSSPK